MLSENLSVRFRGTAGEEPPLQSASSHLPPNLRVTFREVAFPHDCRFLFTTITSFCNRESNRERVRMSGRSFSPRRQTSSRANQVSTLHESQFLAEPWNY